jgi:hypothetical protein
MRGQSIGCLLLLLAAPLWGQWQRLEISGKGISTGTPAPHPLSYFTANPFLRDDGGDLCTDCGTPEGRARSAEEFTAVAAPHTLGTLAGFEIVEVLYRIAKRGEQAKVRWKSILVKVAPDRYLEIYHLQAFYIVPPLHPSRIVHVGDEGILATMDGDGGNGGGCFEGYWWFNASGPHALDFSPVVAAISKRLPAGARFDAGCYALHLDQQEIESGVQKRDAECHACGWIGNVTARFRLNGAVAEPVDVTFVHDRQ